MAASCAERVRAVPRPGAAVDLQRQGDQCDPSKQGDVHVWNWGERGAALFMKQLSPELTRKKEAFRGESGFQSIRILLKKKHANYDLGRAEV